MSPEPPPREPAPEPAAEPADGQRWADPGWDPDGTDLATAFLARSKAVAARGGVPRGASRPAAVRRRTAPAGGAPVNVPAGTTWSGAGGDDRDPQALEATVRHLVDEYGWAEELRVHAVVARWPDIVGAQVAEHARPEEFVPAADGGTLTVRCDSTTWATQLRTLAPLLVRRLNEEIGDRSVATIVVRGPHVPSWSRGSRRVAGRGPRDTYG